MAAMFAVLSAAAPGYAIGYWNVPGNVAQWWGYGWGGGHHACLVLGPISHKGAFDHHQTRLPYAPRPTYGWCNGYSCNNDFHQSWMFAPTDHGDQRSTQFAPPQPRSVTPEALPMPEAAIEQPESVFRAPVER